MPFLGTIVNFLVVLICGILGVVIKKGIPERISNGLKNAMAICVIYIGIDGMLEPAPTVSDGLFLSDGLIKLLMMILSIGLGTLIGEIVDIDKRVNRLGELLERKFASEGDKGRFGEGFVSCSMLFCVGAMTVNGAFADAIGKPDILLAKSVIDGIMCFVMASTLGIGCAASSVFVLVYQGLLTLLGLFIAEIIPAAAISYMSVTGSLIIILIGTNMLGITKAKTANMTPAIFIPAIIWPLITLLISIFS
jgi:uncharacterized membrane protein YqgA involved in biofilm formation